MFGGDARVGTRKAHVVQERTPGRARQRRGEVRPRPSRGGGAHGAGDEVDDGVTAPRLVPDVTIVPGLVKIDGKRVNIPSYTLAKGEVVSLSDKARNMIIIQHNIDTLGRAPVAWLDAQDGGKAVSVRELPTREQIDVPVKEQLFVELYSK